VTPRITPGSRRQVGLLGWAISEVAGRVNRTEPPHLFLTLGRHRRLFLGWLHFAGRLMPGGRLPRADTEAVILRVAHIRQCAYEADHHRHLGRRAGLTDEDLAAVERGPDAAHWTPRRRALLAAADELVEHGALGDPRWQALRSQLTEIECIELVLLVTHYDMLATTIAALRIEPDRPRRPIRRAGGARPSQ
jgi:AhpD family alkylhydroperoxidase